MPSNVISQGLVLKLCAYFAGSVFDVPNSLGNSYVSLTLAITAEFPIEDTGYIEEGFDFCYLLEFFDLFSIFTASHFVFFNINFAFFLAI